MPLDRLEVSGDGNFSTTHACLVDDEPNNKEDSEDHRDDE
jgi:hypothetical protein